MRTNAHVALITGASRGLGREIARLLARDGVRLILTARGDRGLQDAADELRSRGQLGLPLAGLEPAAARPVAVGAGAGGGGPWS